MWTGSMHRLRKKSDAKRGQAPTPAGPPEEQGQDSPRSRKDPQTSQVTAKATIEFLPSLPPTSDFRTSLILPDLYSILRAGDQATLDDLKNRFAEQRARGAIHQITEEEEDMLFDALGRFRSRGSATSRENVTSDGGQDRQSVKSGASANTSVVSSPQSNRSKRYSNNLFGSGRLRDYAYMKSVSSGSSKARSTSTSSITPTESSVAAGRITSVADSTSSASLRPVTPDGTMTSSILSSAQTSPSPVPPETASSIGFASGSANILSEDEESDVVGSRPTSLEQTLAARLDPQAFKRASLALQQAIRELEDETEDEIVLPRTTPIPRIIGLTDPSGHVSDMQRDAHIGEAQTGMAITDDQPQTSMEDKRASPLPSRTHGYVPGMMRPLTPRDLDLEKDRSHSTTPRATSPNMANTPPSSPPIAGGVGVPSISEVLEQTSFPANARQTPRPRTPSGSAAPLFIQRSPSSTGRNTPGLDDEGKKGEHIEFDSPLNSTLLARRRPISPLSNPFQGSTSSRPGTPSNVIWNPSLGSAGNIMKSGTHVRNESWTSDPGSDLQHTLDRHKAPQRNIRSPALPESPTLEGQGTNGRIGSSFYRPATPGATDRPVKAFGGNGDVFSSNRSQRSPTPTQNGFRSSNNSAFGNGLDARGSRRTSRQNAPSPWGYNVPSPLMFNSFANSSRSSIESTGSSYHSWEGDKDKEWLEQLLSGEEEPGPVWHDLSDRRTEPPLTDEQAEELSRKYFGLTLTDLMAIQDKLVSIAATKTASGEFVIRKRRPSTSQSNYVPPRVASPTQLNVSGSPTASSPAEQYSKKASALLNSVVNDIQSKLPPPIDTTSPAVQAASPREPSPGTRRNRALAKILFGSDEAEAPVAEKPSPVSTPQVDDAPSNPDQHLDVSSPPPPSSQQPPQQPLQQPPVPQPQPIVSQPPSSTSVTQELSPVAHSPYGLTRNLSVARVPLTSKNEADLAREIQQKSESATAALKSASKNTLPGDGLSHSGSISRKRIDINQISKPVLLVSPTTSVDDFSPRAPTLSANNSSGASKIGSRFKRLRGTLRAKTHSPISEQATPPQTSESPSNQLANYDPAKFGELGSPVPGSATEMGRPKVAVPSPPASAGPGLKGFISRFRGKQRASDSSSAAPQRGLQQSLSMRQRLPSTLSSTSPDPPSQRVPAQEIFDSSKPRSDSARQPPATTELISEPTPPTGHVSAPSTSNRQSVMIQQLFDAANNLGLDQNALKDLLRSASVSTRSTKLPHSNLRPDSRLGQRGDAPISLVDEGDISQSTIIPPRSETPGSVTATFGNSGGTRPLVLRSDNRRRSRDIKDNPANPIVRRTLILPNDSKPPTPTDTLQRVPSASRRRRGSVNSIPVKERAPTPPPPRSPVKQRFSSDNSPPVPALPGAFLSASSVANIEKPNSTYDSLYEMYTGGEQRTQTPVNPDSGNAENLPSIPDSGHAVELIEYANGDTIWSIVSGLREDDEESIYTSRGSFISEYSPRELGNDRPDNMQVLFKEHKRSGSKGSYNSFALKQKKANTQGKSRPETKVFYSSATQIGRLIENISQGMDAGTFHFSPPPRPGHSASSSLSTNDNWTVEERLEYMLGSMKSS